MWKLILLSAHFAVNDVGSAFMTEHDCVAAGKEVVSQPGAYDVKSSVGLSFVCMPVPDPYVCSGSGAGKEATCYQLDPPK